MSRASTDPAKRLPPLITALLIASVATATAPLASSSWAAAPWFVAAFQSSIFWLDGSTAAVLWTQVYATRREVSLLWLASGYAFAATISIIQLFTYPEILPNREMFGGQQTSAWLWVAWHIGFPLFVIAATASWARQLPERERYPRPFRDLVLTISVGPLLAALLGIVCVAFADQLPVIVNGHVANQSQAGMIRYVVVMVTLGALLALALSTGLRTRLQLWLGVSLFALALEEILAILGGGRYSAGWYVGRCLSLVSAGALMVSLTMRYVRLLRSASQRAVTSQEEARRDVLTGLHNRRYLFERLRIETERARRTSDDLAILLLDLDHFKRLNDTRGHAEGDRCLKALAAVILRRLRRQSDVVARYGGEEFVVILPGTKLAGAKKLAEELRLAVAQAYERGASPHPLTISIGIGVGSGQSGQPLSVESLLAQADQCLYAAKEAGRDRVVAPPQVTLVAAA